VVTQHVALLMRGLCSMYGLEGKPFALLCLIELLCRLASALSQSAHQSVSGADCRQQQRQWLKYYTVAQQCEMHTDGMPHRAGTLFITLW
jgi:hypothetical protein